MTGVGKSHRNPKGEVNTRLQFSVYYHITKDKINSEKSDYVITMPFAEFGCYGIRDKATENWNPGRESRPYE